MFGGIGKFFGISPKGKDMSAADSATEDSVQAALDKLVTGPKAFGNRTISAKDAEAQMRAAGTLPQGWRLRESDSTSSGYRPTQAASKKMGALHAGEVAGAAFGGAAMLGAGPLASLTGTTLNLTNAGIQGGLGAAQGAAQGGLKGALIGGGLGAASGGLVPSGGGLLKNMAVQGGLGAARGAATGGGVKGALIGGGLGAGGAAAGKVAPAVTKNTLGQKAVNVGVNAGLNTARTGKFSPIGTAVSAGTSFLPDAAGKLSTNPATQRAITFGGQQAGNYINTRRFDPVRTGLDAATSLRAPTAPGQDRVTKAANVYRKYLG